MKLRRLVAAAVAAAIALVAPAWAAREAVVTTTVVDMHSAPDEAKDVVSQATLGQVVEVLEARDGFARVRTPDRYEGWLRQSTLSEYADDDAPRYARSGSVVEVTSLMANVYRDADVTTARPLLQAPLATRLEVRGDGPSPRWLAVRLPGGAPGFIQAGDVRRVLPEAPRRRGTTAEIVATARRFLGVPYTWGGMTARGLDCSGLVSRVFHANGIELPRDADMQFEDANAQPVARRDLRPGDLVFFGRDEKHITHVGIWLGGGQFINATTYETPTVRVDRLAEPHWSRSFVGARRPR